MLMYKAWVHTWSSISGSTLSCTSFLALIFENWRKWEKTKTCIETIVLRTENCFSFQTKKHELMNHFLRLNANRNTSLLYGWSSARKAQLAYHNKITKQKKQAIWYEAKKFLRNFYSSATCTSTRLWIVSCSRSYYIVTSLSRNPRGQYTICDMTFVLSVKSNLFAQSINHR